MPDLTALYRWLRNLDRLAAAERHQRITFRMAVEAATTAEVATEAARALTTWEEMARLGVERWEEWQMMEMEFDWVCPHCGAVNWQPCCADNRRAK